jgi:hypothetical protein
MALTASGNGTAYEAANANHLIMRALSNHSLRVL